jgi:hypothetical protein
MGREIIGRINFNERKEGEKVFRNKAVLNPKI